MAVALMCEVAEATSPLIHCLEVLSNNARSVCFMSSCSPVHPNITTIRRDISHPFATLMKEASYPTARLVHSARRYGAMTYNYLHRLANL